jgi:hypothetical protein
MPIVIIFFLCLLSPLVGYVLKKRGVRTAYIWMLFVFISLILWLLLLFIPNNRFSPIIINDWFKFGEINISLQFALNPQNWILVLSLFAFNLSFFLTGIARLDVKNDLRRWIFQLLLLAFSFLALISADLWSVVLLWTVLDLLELAYHHFILKEVNERFYFRKFIIKSLGSILLIWNIAFLSRSGFNSLLNGIVASTPTTSIFLAALMHSGMFPLNIESKKPTEEKSSELLLTVFSVSSFVVSFSVVTSLPAPELPLAISFILSILSYLLIIFSLIQWILIKELNNSIQFLLLGESCGFIFLYFSGAIQNITYTLALLPLSILWLVLFTHRSKNLLIFPVISTFFTTGLPLSLIAFGPRGFIGNGISFGMVVLIFSQILFLIGYLKYAFEKNEKFNELEAWYQAAYLAGLFLSFLSVAAIIFYSRTTFSSEIQFWWIGVTVLTLGLLGYLFSIKIFYKEKAPIFSWQARLTSIWKFLSFEWLFNIFSFVESKVSGFVNGFSRLMEGEGGIMWALVLLILIFTVLTR